MKRRNVKKQVKIVAVYSAYLITEKFEKDIQTRTNLAGVVGISVVSDVIDLSRRYVVTRILSAEQQIASLMAEPFCCCCRCRGSICAAP